MSRSAYRSLLLAFIDRVGDGLVKMSVILLILLMITQLLLNIDELRYYLSETYRLEGSYMEEIVNP